MEAYATDCSFSSLLLLPKLTLTPLEAALRSALERSREPTVSTSSFTSSRGLPGTTAGRQGGGGGGGGLDKWDRES